MSPNPEKTTQTAGRGGSAIGFFNSIGQFLPFNLSDSRRRQFRYDLNSSHLRVCQNPTENALEHALELLRVSFLFALTALAEIIGCYLPWLVLRQGRTPYLLVPAALSLAIFAWLLTLHPSAAGRTYAAYGGMYIVVALLWLRFVDGISLTRWDLSGATIALIGMAVIALQPSTN